MKIRYLLLIAVLSTAVLCFGAGASAQSADAITAQIAQLQAQLAQLNAQLQSLQGDQQGTTPSAVPAAAGPDNSIPWCHDFLKNLGYADSGSDEVGALHTALLGENIESGDKGNKYGPATANAVKRFQKKYGISQTGFFGTATRIQMNNLYGCSLRQYIKITSPNGGEIFQDGETMNIQWQFVGQSENVYIYWEVFDVNNKLANTALITSGPIANFMTAGSSFPSYSWTIPSDFTKVHVNWARVKIVVASTQDKTVWPTDKSNNYFKIIARSNADNCKYDGADGNNIGNVYKENAESCKANWDAFGANRPGSKVYYNGALIYTYGDTTPSITVGAPVGGEVLTMNSKVVDSLSSVDSQKQIFEIKWTGAPDSFTDIYGDKNPARIAAYLEQKVGEQYNVIGRIIPMGYGSIMWIVGEVSDTNCLMNNDDSRLYPNHCYHSTRLVSPGIYDIKIVDTQTNAFGRSNNFNLITSGVSILRISALASPDNQITAGQKFTISGWNFYAPDTVYVGNELATLAQDVAYQQDGTGIIQAIAPNDLVTGDAYVTVKNVNGTSNKYSVVTLPASTQPSITVTSPNGGETWQTGSMQTIRWTTNNIPATNNMTVRLRDEAGVEHYFYGASDFSNIVPNNGFFSVTVPTTLALGKYKAEVKTAVGGQSYLDASDNYFTISTTNQPSLSISGVTGLNLTYAPADKISFLVKGVESDGTPATNSEGFNVQAYICKNGDCNNYLPPNPPSSYNGTYNSTTGLWNVAMNAPFDSTAAYTMKIALYCSQTNSYCWNKYGGVASGNSEVDKLINFSVSALTLPSITGISPASGPVGSSFAITGLNFTATGNQISFECPAISGGGGIASAPSSDGKTLTGNVPSFAVLYGTTITYPLNCNVGVANANGTSNKVPFNVTSSPVCTPNWVCGTWSACVDKSQTRICTDLNNCGTTTGKPATTQSCTTQPSITITSPAGGETWNIGDWRNISWTSSGVSKVQIDAVKGTSTYKLNVIDASLGNFSWKVGAGYGTVIVPPGQNYQIAIYDVNNPSTVNKLSSYFTISSPTTCTPNWLCTNWGPCLNGSQTRYCNDSNNCGTTTGKPTTTQTCTTSTGSISSAVDASTPANQIVSGNQTITAGKFKFTATGNNFTINEVRFTAPSSAATTVINSLILKDGSTVLSVTPYDVAKDYFYLTGLNVTIPANTTKTLTVDLALGTPYSDTTTVMTGKNAKVSLAYFKATNNSAGTISTDISVRPANDVYVVKSFPTFTMSSLSTMESTNLAMGADTSLFTFNVSADSKGPVALKQLIFNANINSTNATLGTFKFFKGSANMTSDVNIQKNDGTTLEAGNTIGVGSNNVVVTFNTEEIVSAGQTFSYTLKAAGSSFMPGNSVSTTLLPDGSPSSPSGMYYLNASSDTGVQKLAVSQNSNTGAVENIIWSDQNAQVHDFTHNLSSADWLNGYLLPNLSGFGPAVITIPSPGQAAAISTAINKILEQIRAILGQ